MIEEKKAMIKYLLLSVQLLFLVTAISGQDKYRAVHWGSSEGLSVETNNVFLKDVNGFLWITSPSGLNRFDGSNFKIYLPDKNKSGTILGVWGNSLIEDSLHHIWIGTERGLSRYDIKADTFKNIWPADPAIHSDIIPFWATKDEVYCVEASSTITSYDIHSFSRKTLTSLSPEDVSTLSGAIAQSVFDAGSNSVWLLHGVFGQAGGGLLQVSLADGKKSYYSWPCYKSIPGHDHWSRDMVYDQKRNAIWISSPDGLIEFTLEDRQFHHVDAFNDILSLKDDLHDQKGIALDPWGQVWWCSSSTGILIYDPSTRKYGQVFSDLPRQMFLAAGNYRIYCDKEGMVWTSTWYDTRGIYQIIPASLPVYRYKTDNSQPGALSENGITGIIKADHGKIWIGQGDEIRILDTHTGLFQLFCNGKDLPAFKGHAVTQITPIKVDTVHGKALLDITNEQPGTELIQIDIRTKQCRHLIFKDSTGQRMVDPPAGNVCSFKNDVIVTDDNGKGIFLVNSENAEVHWIAPGVKGGVGLITDNKNLLFIRLQVNNLTYSLQHNKWTRTISPFDSLGWTGGAIYHNEKDNTYWAGDLKQLVHYDEELQLIKRYTQEDGLNSEDITRILSDDRGNLWIQTLRSILMLNIQTGRFTLLGEKDGLKKQAYGPNAPIEVGGDLYFWGDFGVDRIRPDKLTASYPPSSTYLKSITINQIPIALSTGVNDLRELSLKYFQNKINLETGIIDYYTKGTSHIRYKLEGINDLWQTAPANYTIRYDGLPPGAHWLVIQASNAANDFNGPEKRLLINIHPPFWETWWFRMTMGIIFLFILYGAYRWRTATLRKQKRVLEQTVKERTAEVEEEKSEIERQKGVIEKEKEKSDELLLNILPSEVAEELKEKGYTTAKSFDEVTILFSDIKGFTMVAENMTAQNLVKEIDTYFSAFDRIMQQYGLEKIKTIGDAYVAAGGLPEKNMATVKKVVEAAIAMQNIVDLFKKERTDQDLPYFELRIGIHTGPVVAGVVGIKKFQYDIWGDTVNLAARMEESCVPGKINISQNTYDLIKGDFKCVHRGRIEAKNKGEINMYFIEQEVR